MLDKNSACFLLLCIFKIQHNESDNYLRFYVARSISYGLSMKQSHFYSKNMILKWIDISCNLGSLEYLYRLHFLLKNYLHFKFKVYNFIS